MCIRDSFYYVRLDATQYVHSYLISSRLFSYEHKLITAWNCYRRWSTMRTSTCVNMNLWHDCALYWFFYDRLKNDMCISHGVFRSNTHFKGSLCSFQWSDFFLFFYLALQHVSFSPTTLPVTSVYFKFSVFSYSIGRPICCRNCNPSLCIQFNTGMI